MTTPSLPEPELATTPEWRVRMKQARVAKKLSQEALGKLVGATQSLISQIESGTVESSDRVLPICRTLEIDAPIQAGVTPLDERWRKLAERLKARGGKTYEAQIRSLEIMLDTQDQDDE